VLFVAFAEVAVSTVTYLTYCHLGGARVCRCWSDCGWSL